MKKIVLIALLGFSIASTAHAVEKKTLLFSEQANSENEGYSLNVTLGQEPGVYLINCISPWGGELQVVAEGENFPELYQNVTPGQYECSFKPKKSILYRLHFHTNNGPVLTTTIHVP